MDQQQKLIAFGLGLAAVAAFLYFNRSTKKPASRKKAVKDKKQPQKTKTPTGKAPTEHVRAPAKSNKQKEKQHQKKPAARKPQKTVAVVPKKEVNKKPAPAAAKKQAAPAKKAAAPKKEKPAPTKPAKKATPEVVAKPEAKKEVKPAAKHVPKAAPKKAAVVTPPKKAEPKTGVLHISNIRGQGLANKDKTGSGDPYIVFQCGNVQNKTKTNSGANPTFSEVFAINVRDPNATLTVTGMDWDRWTAHDEIGHTTPSVEVFRKSKRATTHQFDLNKKGKEGAQGKIIFDVVWEPKA